MIIELSNQNLGYDEVVDTFVDAFSIARRVDQVTADGFQPLPDLIALSGEFITVKEIIDDSEVFWAQFRDLDAQESEAVYQEVADRVGEPRNGIETRIFLAMSIARRVHRVTDSVRGEFNAIVDEAKLLVGSNPDRMAA